MSTPPEESVGMVAPDRIRFTQSSVSYRLRSGQTIEELAEGLKSGTIRPGVIPPIRLIEKDGILFTLDNRRLEAFRRAGIDVPYRLATAEEIETEAWKFTTTNGGTSVRVRGDPYERPAASPPDAAESRSDG